MIKGMKFDELEIHTDRHILFGTCVGENCTCPTARTRYHTMTKMVEWNVSDHAANVVRSRLSGVEYGPVGLGEASTRVIHVLGAGWPQSRITPFQMGRSALLDVLSSLVILVGSCGGGLMTSSASIVPLVPGCGGVRPR
jgi:hypothetical protein